MRSLETIDPTALEQTLRQFVTPEGRSVGTQGNIQARQFIVDCLVRAEIEPYSEDEYLHPYRNMYSVNGESVNVAARIPGSDRTLPPLLIGAHYDTCGPQPGADDNGAAVAILLHISPLMKKRRFRRDIIVAFFDAEEPPSFREQEMGSIRFFEDHLQGNRPACAVILDLVGHDIPIPGMEDCLAVTGFDTSSALAETADRNFSAEDVTILQTRDLGLCLSDHIIFHRNSIPFLFLTCGCGPHYHQPGDRVETLNYPKISGTASALVAIMEKLDGAELESSHQRGSITELEIAQMNRLLERVGPIAGLPPRINTERQLEAIYDFLKCNLSV